MGKKQRNRKGTGFCPRASSEPCTVPTVPLLPNCLPIVPTAPALCPRLLPALLPALCRQHWPPGHCSSHNCSTFRKDKQVRQCSQQARQLFLRCLLCGESGKGAGTGWICDDYLKHKWHSASLYVEGYNEIQKEKWL